jgi:hypothetical protein
MDGLKEYTPMITITLRDRFCCILRIESIFKWNTGCCVTTECTVGSATQYVK